MFSWRQAFGALPQTLVSLQVNVTAMCAWLWMQLLWVQC